MGRQGWLGKIFNSDSNEGKKGEKAWQPGWILQPGQVLVNNYRVENMIGSPGGMGQVYVAEDISLKLKVAIKVPVLNILLAPKGAEVFLEEAQKAAKLRPHPHIVLINACLTDPEFSVPVNDARKEVPIPFIVMEYLGGGDLANRLGEETLSFETIADLFEKICLAVHYAHTFEYRQEDVQQHGMIHRDLKPENICFDEQGRPVVVDFGLARLLENPKTSGGISGTPTHMAPEQWYPVKYGGIDQRTDIYALGVILYQMVTGQLPFNENSIEDFMEAHLTISPPDPRDLRPDTPQRIVEIIQKAMEKDKSARFESAQTLADNVLQGLSTVEQPVSSDTPLELGSSKQGAVIPEILEKQPGISLKPTDKDGSWKELKSSGERPSKRMGHSAVWDEISKKMYILGGATLEYQSNLDLWVFESRNNSWKSISPMGSPPPLMNILNAVIDLTEHKIYVYGKGIIKPRLEDFNGNIFEVYPVQYGIWIYWIDTNSWHFQEISPELGDTNESSAVWDPKGKRIFTFGGSPSMGGSPNYIMWVYTLTNNSWEILDPVGETPHARAGHSAIWDQNNDSMILFGGWGDGKAYNDLWIYVASTNSWSQLEPSGILPPSRWSHCSVWDSTNRRMYIFGGDMPTDFIEAKRQNELGMYAAEAKRLNELWMYSADDNAWKLLIATGETPEIRVGHTAVWDDMAHRMYIFGGLAGDKYTTQYADDLWAFTPEATPQIQERQPDVSLQSSEKSNTWTELKPSGENPPPRSYSLTLWDEDLDRMYVIGGTKEEFGLLNDFWMYTARENSWTSLALPDSFPLQPAYLTAAFNSSARRIYVIDTESKKMWIHALDTGSWENQDIHSGMVNVHSTRTVWDPNGERLFTFMESEEGKADCVLWVYSASSNSWKQLVPLGEGPPKYVYQSAVWDQMQEKIFVFGGSIVAGANSFNHIWVYTISSNSWSQIEPTGEFPAGINYFSKVWNMAERKTYVFGGQSTFNNINDLWEYNAAKNAWKKLAPSGILPAPRSNHSAVWDSRTNRMYIFGGYVGEYGSEKATNELWTYKP